MLRLDPSSICALGVRGDQVSVCCTTLLSTRATSMRASKDAIETCSAVLQGAEAGTHKPLLSPARHFPRQCQCMSRMPSNSQLTAWRMCVVAGRGFCCCKAQQES